MEHDVGPTRLRALKPQTKYNKRETSAKGTVVSAELGKKARPKQSPPRPRPSSSPCSLKSRHIYPTSDLLRGKMGGLGDEASSQLVDNQHRDEEQARNQENEQGHRIAQEPAGNNAKWVKEGQNQLRKDQNRNPNRNQNPDRNPNHNGTQEEQPGEGEKTASNKTLRFLCSDLESKNSANKPLLIDNLVALEGEEDEEEEEEEEEGTRGKTRKKLYP
ncbi:hypothetical protein AAFF_G00079100 [Aldrovandia affinis]|uniref:Uncharacterized protein n=1 Tax=Aldrovandia affinis TaxID=143900 RepID=A0AAD7RXI3_9TELE|nr:hypothetical protein AAFF_G00079100 [Aldrovandia affinis]